MLTKRRLSFRGKKVCSLSFLAKRLLRGVSSSFFSSSPLSFYFRLKSQLKITRLSTDLTNPRQGKILHQLNDLYYVPVTFLHHWMTQIQNESRGDIFQSDLFDRQGSHRRKRRCPLGRSRDSSHRDSQLCAECSNLTKGVMTKQSSPLK